jgi:serine/threonine-protein kinase
MTSTAAVIGTAQYLSPEQARGEGVDARSDVYSLGCLLYELVTGAPPFTGDSPVSVAYQHVREDPRLPSSINRAIPPELDAILLKAMSKNPANRYQSAAEMRNDLLRALAGQRVEATPVMGEEEKTTILAAPPGGYGIGGGRYGGGYPDEDERWDDEEDEQARRRRRNWIIAAVVIAVLLIGGIIGIALALGNGSGQPAVTQVAVPDVTGKTPADAGAALQAAGLKLGAQTSQTSTTDQKGKVLSTKPTVGTKVDKGTTVDIVVGGGPNTIAVPGDLVNLSEQQARALLASAGFTGTIQTKPVDSLQKAGTVVSVDPPSGSQVAPDTTITLSLASGTIKMPDVRNKTEDAARKALTDAGVNAGDIQSVAAERNDVAPGTVVDTNPAPGATLKSGDTVTLQVATPVPTSSPTTATATGTATGTGTATHSP